MKPIKMINLSRTTSKNKDFINLVQDLDEYLKIQDGKDHSFYNQFNSIDHLKYVIVAYDDKTPIGCGAIKKYDENTMEIKRMFVSNNIRGKGIATKILLELENWSKELSFSRCILETGLKQVEAIKLYEKSSYKVIPNYGQYENIQNSICFEKKMNHEF